MKYDATALRKFVVLLSFAAPATAPVSVWGQTVTDGSDAQIGKPDARKVLDLIGRDLKNASDSKVTSLRRSKGSVICGSVNVKGPDGRYLGERGFVVDLAQASFGRVPDGPELLNPRDPGYHDKERIRELYFDMCLDD